MFQQPPRIVEYGTHDIVYRHYGKSIEMMINAVCDLPEGPDKDKMVTTLANHMKKSYLTWNRDTVGDDIILKDLKKLSHGRLNTENIQLNEAREILQQKKRSRRPMRKNK
jgi:hypothetical protein